MNTCQAGSKVVAALTALIIFSGCACALTGCRKVNTAQLFTVLPACALEQPAVASCICEEAATPPACFPLNLT